MIYFINENDGKGGNSELKHWVEPIPDGYYKHLCDTLKKYQDSGMDRDCEGYKRLCNLVNNKTITYLDMKRIKNYFDNCGEEARNTIPYYLNGGDTLRNWIDSKLKEATEAVKSYKQTKKKMGVTNAFHKPYNQMGNVVDSKHISESVDNPKSVILTESQAKFLVETRGVSDECMSKAKEIVEAVIDAIPNIEKELEECKARYTDEEDSDEWIWDFEYTLDAGDCRIDLEWDNSNKKAETGGENEITINYRFIQEQVEDANDRYRLISDKYPAMLGMFNLDSQISENVSVYLYPVVLHELTHCIDKSDRNNDHIWLKSHHHFNTEDLKDILYTFATTEMNARIASAASICWNELHYLYNSSDSGKRWGDITNEDFQDVYQSVLDNSELQIHTMEVYLDMIEREYNSQKESQERGYGADRNYIQTEHQPLSLTYDLYRCDSRLNKNRNIERYFKQNYTFGTKYVASFYRKLYEDYLKKIERTCYYVFDKFKDEYMQKEKEVFDE